MIKRYPHTAEMIVTASIKKESGIPSSKEVKLNIKGRFEPSSSRNGSIDYKAKYYCKNLDYLLKSFVEEGIFPEELISQETKELIPFSVDGQKMIYNGKTFEIILLHNYQTHCEIWLE